MEEYCSNIFAIMIYKGKIKIWQFRENEHAGFITPLRRLKKVNNFLKFIFSGLQKMCLTKQ